MSMDALIALPAFIAVAFAAAITGAIFLPDHWYHRLDKPRWQPPDWAFPPVWTVLYLCIGAAGWLAWRETGVAAAPLAFAAYALQLVFNAAWTPLFFGLHRPDLAFADLVLLWFSIAATIALFAPISASAALLLVPYLGWVTFAGAVNFEIWRRNPQGLPAT
jgi:tryptophan-rich sensory protein